MSSFDFHWSNLVHVFEMVESGWPKLMLHCEVLDLPSGLELTAVKLRSHKLGLKFP